MQEPPPGHQLSQPGYGSAFERSGALASAVLVVAVIWTVIHWLWVLAAPSAVEAYRNAAVSGTPVYEVTTAYDLLGLPAFLVAIAVFVLTGIWLGRARRNADRIAPADQRRSTIWVWLGWVVPIVSFWFPKQVVDDVWRSTARTAGPPETGWWWGTWIAANLLGALSARAFNSFTGEPVEAILENLVLIDLLTALALTVALVGWIRVVRTVSQAQDALVAGAPPQA